ncbi:gamma-glutamylcyclotransferase [Sedimentimonas flavescens]|uniref:gamma-glutamylcyclotransferase n=1 Tax=Sedimentimonas flavescens TaxID=2851012 RepID=UPI001C4A15C2|nr:gamma-glutamylcyclotransferase [Sedimentimonas flavescens]MBW0159039.1 gamma-glutamylcyclotransferase [Sedimentimonas flavescens]MCT2540019.1 gamma-glutamylcyclotransferase [Sedimentimonas flavescens]
MTKTLWIFGYGSLIWDPGFAPAEVRRAWLRGWHRSFCMRSIHFRGTPEAPGLVLALDASPDAVCAGLAFRVAEPEADEVLACLRARELVSDAYLEHQLPVTCEEGETFEAITYVIDREGPQYCALDLEEQARIIAHAIGGRGPNRDYLFNTAAHLTELGLADPDLDWLSARVRELTR